MGRRKSPRRDRIFAALTDVAIEWGGGFLGAYFGVMVAALLTSVKGAPPHELQSAVFSGFKFGFVFFFLSVSFVNRVLIQGLSRSSIGKKLFHLELIPLKGPLTWQTVIYRWCIYFVPGRDHFAKTQVVPVFQGQLAQVIPFPVRADKEKKQSEESTALKKVA